MSGLWVTVGRASDVPLWEGRRVTVEGRRIAIFRTAGGFHAVDADCPHARGPLQDGLVADACVTCPLHGWRFSLRDGARLGGDGAAVLDVYEVEVSDGQLRLLVPAAEPVGAPS